MANRPRIIFNSINTRSAGTQAVTALMVEQLENSDCAPHSSFAFVVSERQGIMGSFRSRNVAIELFELGTGLVSVLRRLWFEIFAFPRYVRNSDPQCVVVLGNYSFRRLPAAKYVLVRHPYLLLLDHHDVLQLPLRRRLQEYARSLVFLATRRCTDNWIVQSAVMQKSLARRWNIPLERIAIIPNPVEAKLIGAKSSQAKGKQTKGWRLIYPSRWYEHKNHEKLLRFAEKEERFLTEQNIQILVTVANVAESADFLKELQDSRLPNSVMRNLGEIPKPDLYAWYQKSDAVIFPSESETFGNGLIEGACFSLPLLVADRPYADAFDKKNLIVFEPDDPSSIRRSIERLMSDYESWVLAANQVANLAIDSQTWVERLEEHVSADKFHSEEA